ncbi:hypothetical protein [Paenibacillus sp. PAMC21692]|uniref:hypothetical protein n=1 Tax=Paenibacillus sp. PAMC21692 TaxID=2762320 RepID=UPI00164DDBB5|nr:hypothetical protein [Paenibacillus sp. PAMC21692]QNK57390.1 hypothetical protein H7F31_33820 [Paenibacillus sp. PAMC21692]
MLYGDITFLLKAGSKTTNSKILFVPVAAFRRESQADPRNVREYAKYLSEMLVP